MKDLPFKQTSSYKPYHRGGDGHKPPGKPVGIITVGDHTIYLTVSPWRNDFNQMVDQIEKGKRARLPLYELSLFYGCFKNWL